jgi:hypothetical protein
VAAEDVRGFGIAREIHQDLLDARTVGSGSRQHQIGLGERIEALNLPPELDRWARSNRVGCGHHTAAELGGAGQPRPDDIRVGPDPVEERLRVAERNQRLELQRLPHEHALGVRDAQRVVGVRIGDERHVQRAETRPARDLGERVVQWEVVHECAEQLREQGRRLRSLWESQKRTARRQLDRLRQLLPGSRVERDDQTRPPLLVLGEMRRPEHRANGSRVTDQDVRGGLVQGA